MAVMWYSLLARSAYMTLENTDLDFLSRVQVFLSVGGGAYPSSQFSQLASSKSARASFILSTITLLRKHVLHGLDVDWWV